MGVGTVVGVGVDCRDSKGQAPCAWPPGWRGHRPRKLPLATYTPSMGLGSGAQQGTCGECLARVFGSCAQGGGRGSVTNGALLFLLYRSEFCSSSV